MKMNPLTIEDFRRHELFWAPERAGVSEAIGVVMRFRQTYGRDKVFLMLHNLLVVVTPTATLEDLAEAFWTEKLVRGEILPPLRNRWPK